MSERGWQLTSFGVWSLIALWIFVACPLLVMYVPSLMEGFFKWLF